MAEKTNIDPKTYIGLVSLNVRDFEELKHFYSQYLMLDILKENEKEVTLGYKNNEIVKLIKTSYSFPQFNSAGLYHLAILFEKRGRLSKVLKNILHKAPGSFSGSGDHGVSEAFYFTDPEGNGVELYYDRPKTAWTWIGDKVVMKTEYIDEKEYIKENINEEESDVKIGHIHLKVGGIPEAKEFYVDKLGFEIMAELSSALFVSAGKYHHHIGMNIWESKGASKRDDCLGLECFEIVIPKEYLTEFEEKLINNGIDYKNEDEKLTFTDPWNNKINIRIE